MKIKRWRIFALQYQPPKLEKEYGNPFLGVQKYKQSFTPKQKEAFSFREDVVDDDAKIMVSFSIPQEPILVFSKSQETSVAAVFSWFIMRTIFAVTKTNLPVTIAVPLNARKHIGCLETNRNCNTTIHLSLTPHFLRHDRAEQLTAIRAEMYLQADEINVLPKMYGLYSDWLETSKCKTIADRVAYYHSDDNLAMSPIISYIGLFEIPGYEEYYEKLDWYLPVSGPAGILTYVVSDKGMFHSRIIMNLKDSDTYVKTFFHILEENEIPVTHGEVKAYSTQD